MDINFDNVAIGAVTGLVAGLFFFGGMLLTDKKMQGRTDAKGIYAASFVIRASVLGLIIWLVYKQLGTEAFTAMAVAFLGVRVFMSSKLTPAQDKQLASPAVDETSGEESK